MTQASSNAAPPTPERSVWVHAVIDACLSHRRVVLAAAALLLLVAVAIAAGLKLDALPDLSETQVIVKAEYPGRPPRLVEDQVTYPLTASLLGVPGATSVRGFSMFGEAFVYVVFEEGIDSARARSRVLERTAQVGGRLPPGASVSLGPDASGTGWIYQYALVGSNVPIEKLRSLQDFTLRQELQAVPGVAEVATFGGAPRQLQIDLDPARMQAAGVTVEEVMSAVRDANQASGGGAIELGRQRFFLSADARIRPGDDLARLPVRSMEDGTTIRLGQVAGVSTGPAPREGVADLDGRGDVVGGIVVMRQGENAAETARRLKERIEAIRTSLPPGVSLVETYDRSRVIEEAVRSLGLRLLEEAAVVVLVCAVFLGRMRSALVAVVTLPLGLATALAILRLQGVTANIMSLGGLAIAIGAMVDASLVLVETHHRKLESGRHSEAAHWAAVRQSAREVGPALFFSLLVITVSFLPVFSLQGQEGKLFSPLALTKTYAMAAAAALSISVVPVLMGQFVRGPVPREHRNPVNRALRRMYRPLLLRALAHPRRVVLVSVLLAASAAYPLWQAGSEFMPPLDEGDLLYMPTTLPSVSVDEAEEILRRTDALIRSFPEVASVHGKAGRSDSATDPAPLSMLETIIVLKPRQQWPEQITTQELIRRLDERVRLAGLSNAWGYPIRTRMDMLATGVKTPLALKITGPDLAAVQALAEEAEGTLRQVPGIAGAFAERTTSGRFIELELRRDKLDLYGIRVAEVTRLLDGPLGGMAFDVVSDGRERMPVVLRFPRALKESVDSIGELRLRAMNGTVVNLSEVAAIRVRDGASEVRSENARPVGYVLLSLASSDVGGVLARASQAVAQVERPEGYLFTWVGQYMRLAEARWRLSAISAGTLLSVVLILYWHFREWRRVALVMASLPAAACGALWLVHLLGYQWSFATVVGMLALAGVAAEFCVVMLLYVEQSLPARAPGAQPHTQAEIRRAVLQGALRRLRPKSMTVAVILGGLLPIMVADGVGVDVMRRIAAPMVGGMVTAPLFSLFVIPAAYLLIERGRA